MQIQIQIKKRGTNTDGCLHLIYAPFAHKAHSNSIVFNKVHVKHLKNIPMNEHHTLYTRCACIFTTHTHKYKYKKLIPKVRNTNAETPHPCTTTGHNALNCTEIQCNMMPFFVHCNPLQLKCIARWCRMSSLTFQVYETWNLITLRICALSANLCLVWSYGASRYGAKSGVLHLEAISSVWYLCSQHCLKIHVIAIWCKIWCNIFCI